jgi:flagella basal body P-ring formation protein FlgA
MSLLRPLAIVALAVLLPAAVLAQPASQLVPAARLAAVADRLASAVVTDPDKSIAPAYGLVDQAVPAGDVTIVAGTPQVNPTFVAVPITIAVGGKTCRTILAGYRVTSYIHTAVAAHDLAPGTVLTEDDVTTDRIAFTGRQAVEAVSLVGRRLRTSMPKGGALFVEQTSMVDLVKAGSNVVLIVRDGSVALTADVIARTSGGLGDLVAVFNPQTRKALSGVVTGPNRVELNLPGASE